MAVGSVRKLKPSDPASPWVYEYTDPDTGKRVRKTPKDGKKKSALALQAEIAAELFSGSHVAASRTITMESLCEEFFENMRARHREKRGVGATYLRNSRFALDKSIIPVVGKIKAADLNFLDVEKIAKTMAESGKHERTIQMRLQLLKMIMEFGIRRGYAKDNPVSRVVKDRGRAEKVPIRQFGFEEIGALFNALRDRPKNGRQLQHDRTVIFVHMAATMGLRFGEILGLTAGAINFDAGVLQVKHSMTSMDELKGPKTKAGNRELSIPDHVLALLRKWMLDGYVDNERGLLFKPPKLGEGRRSTNLTVFNFRAAWLRLLTRAGLDADLEQGPYHFHALRHFHSSYLIHKGVPVTDIAEMMGHRFFDTTLQVYAHPITPKRERREQMQRIADDLLSMREVFNATALPVPRDGIA